MLYSFYLIMFHFKYIFEFIEINIHKHNLSYLYYLKSYHFQKYIHHIHSF
jgi:hypothetical protein